GRIAVDHPLSDRDDLISDEGGAGQQQHRRAGRQEGGHELPLDGQAAQAQVHFPPSSTSSDSRSSLELMVSRAVLAALMLIRRRTLFLSMAKRTTPPSFAGVSRSMTVRVLCPFKVSKTPSARPLSDRLTKRI